MESHIASHCHYHLPLGSIGVTVILVSCHAKSETATAGPVFNLARSEKSSLTVLMSFETPLPPYNASDPYATFVNSSCFDLLLIEMVPLASRLAEGSAAKRGAVLSNVDEEEESEIAFRKLDSIGYRVGQGLVER